MAREFDPDAAAAAGSGLYGLPHGPEESGVWIVPVPFDATTSYRQGAAQGPAAVLAASRQVDLADAVFGELWRAGLCLLEVEPALSALQEEASARAAGILAVGGAIEGDATLAKDLARVNAIGAELNLLVERRGAEALDSGRLPVVLGGDHSVPFGAMKAAAERHPGLGVLHFDAHADLREAYEGFTWSHASIFWNVLEHLPGVERLVQIGLRDVGSLERDVIERAGTRVRVLYDHEWARARFEGRDLVALVRSTIALLPEEVWLSFDVDGLDPALCPNTGTPVPGGLSWHEATLWLEELARSGRRVVGLDLCEVSPGEGWSADSEAPDTWDAIVGARLLYRMIGSALATRSGR